MGTSRRLPPEGVDFHTPWRLTIDTCDRRPCESWDARTVSRWVFPAPTPEAIRRTIFRQLLSPRGRHCPPGDRDACHRVRARRRARCRSGPGHLALPLISHVRRCTVTLTLPSARPSQGNGLVDTASGRSVDNAHCSGQRVRIVDRPKPRSRGRFLSPCRASVEALARQRNCGTARFSPSLLRTQEVYERKPAQGSPGRAPKAEQSRFRRPCGL